MKLIKAMNFENLVKKKMSWLKYAESTGALHSR